MKYYVENLDKDIKTKYGTISKEDLKKEGTIKSSTGKEFLIFNAGFADEFNELKKLPQGINKKDIGIIMAETGVDKNSIVVDAGTGSGHLASYLAHICKEVYTYEIKENHLEISRKNAVTLGLKNITFFQGSVYDEIKEKDIDIITLDLPEPVKAIDNSIKALKRGGHLVVYMPCLPALEEFIKEVKQRNELYYVKTIELIERKWKIEGKIVRPDNVEIGHTAFLCFVRRV